MNQQFLDEITNKTEAKFLLSDVDAWCSHRPLLYVALEMTKQSNKPILELGCGHGSTAQLSQYIKIDHRKLISFDTNQEWVNKFSHLQNDRHEFVYKPDNFVFNPQTQEWYDKTPELTDWLKEITQNGISICLVDHACGERRHSDIKLIYEKCDIMVIHDSEPNGAGNYMFEKIWGLFKYKINIKKWGAWATMVSNKYDLTKLNNTKINNFEMSI